MAWVDQHRLLLADEFGLSIFHLESLQRDRLVDIEAGDTTTRSNDGRCDRHGGFWTSTMGCNAEAGKGAIYRFYQGEVRQVAANLTVPNATCFAPDGSFAVFGDTRRRLIWKIALDAAGWPTGQPSIFVSMVDQTLNPDGAVFDKNGCLWVAQWGASRVTQYGPDGVEISHIPFPSVQTTCPCFGGPDFKTVYMTSATVGLTHPLEGDGQTFQVQTTSDGLAEPRFRLQV